MGRARERERERDGRGLGSPTTPIWLWSSSIFSVGCCNMLLPLWVNRQRKASPLQWCPMMDRTMSSRALTRLAAFNASDLKPSRWPQTKRKSTAALFCQSPLPPNAPRDSCFNTFPGSSWNWLRHEWQPCNAVSILTDFAMHWIKPQHKSRPVMDWEWFLMQSATHKN